MEPLTYIIDIQEVYILSMPISTPTVTRREGGGGGSKTRQIFVLELASLLKQSVYSIYALAKVNVYQILLLPFEKEIRGENRYIVQSWPSSLSFDVDPERYNFVAKV